MRVSIIANGFQEDYILNLLNSLATKNVEIEFIGSSFYPSDKIDSRIQFVNLRGDHDEQAPFYKKVLRILKYYVKLSVYLATTKATSIHVQWLKFYLVEGFFFVWYARLFRKRCYYTVQDVLPHDKPTLLNRIIFFLIYHSQHCLIAHTEFIRERLIREFKVNQKRIAVVKHGVYDTQEDVNITHSRAREILQIPDNEFVLLFFGIITKYKGLELLLDVFTRFRKKYDHVTLIIAGRVAKDYVDEYNKVVNSYPLEKIIQKTTFIPASDVELYFKSANLTMLPYKEASQSGVLFMSYAFGIPVLAPKLGGFVHDVVEENTGYLFEPGDAESLYEKLDRAGQQLPGNHKEWSNRIKLFAETYYSWSASAEALVKIYK
jgi:glycosyltransferase involved in cell wall biosynthesis